MEQQMDTPLQDGAIANTKAFTSIAIAMLGAIMFGVDCANFGLTQGFPSFVAKWCDGHWDADSERATGQNCTDGGTHNDGYLQTFCMWSNVLITVGAATGVVVLGPTLAERQGRRMCISVGSGMTFVGCTISAFLSFDTESIFYFSRFVTGFGVGTCCYCLPMFNSEMATAAIRGRTGSYFQLFTVLGQVIATFIMLPLHVAEVGLMMPGVFGLIVCGLIWTVPESPRWVQKKQGYEAGYLILRQVRDGSDEMVKKEAKEIQDAIEAEGSMVAISYRDVFREANLRKRTFIGCWLQVAQQMTGVNAFLGYANTLFPLIGISNPYIFNVIWNLVMLVGVQSGRLFIDAPSGGRRVQLLVATWIMAPSLFLGGAILQFNWPSILCAIVVCIYAFGFQLAWGMIPWIYPSEIFKQCEREVAMSYTVFFQYGINAVIFFVTPQLMGWSISGTMYTFGALNAFNLLFVITMIKETKGVPLEKVPALFGAVAGSFISNRGG